MRLKIRHNMEMAHRLSLQEGKCRNIHGHGMQVELVLLVEQGADGMAVNNIQEPLDFSELKKRFRDHIDSTYDHRLVLNVEDEWAQPIFQVETWPTGEVYMEQELDGKQKFLPGLSLVNGDPTVENLAKWIAHWACGEFSCDVICRIDETQTNGAEAMYQFAGQLGPRFIGGAR